MASTILDADYGIAASRVSALEQALVAARAEMEALVPSEPEAIGSVVRFRKYNFGYTFAAIKTPNELWYITQDGTRTSRQGHAPKSWDDLLAWIGQRNWHRIEVLG